MYNPYLSWEAIVSFEGPLHQVDPRHGRSILSSLGEPGIEPGTQEPTALPSEQTPGRYLAGNTLEGVCGGGGGITHRCRRDWSSVSEVDQLYRAVAAGHYVPDADVLMHDSRCRPERPHNVARGNLLALLYAYNG